MNILSYLFDCLIQVVMQMALEHSIKALRQLIDGCRR